MGNPLNTQSTQQPNLQQMRQQFNQNPLQFLRGFNIPEGMTDPQAIVQHLYSTGQVPPKAQALISMMGRR